MAIDPKDPSLIDLTTAAKEWKFGRKKGFNIATWHRWSKDGRKGARLEVLRVGGRVLTTDAAIRDFIAKLNGESRPAHVSIDAGIEAGRQLEAEGA